MKQPQETEAGIMADIRETFETASKVLHASSELMEAFGGFLRRVRSPLRSDGSESLPPYECRTPVVLWDRWQQLHSVSEELEIAYLYDPASKVDILRALSSRPRMPVPTMLNVTAETHVEAVYLVGSHIHGRITTVCESMANGYDVMDRNPGFGHYCERAADEVRDFMPNGPVASTSLDYLRRAVAAEEATCREFFNPAVPSVERDETPQWDGPPKHKLTVNPSMSEATLDGSIIPLKRQQAKALRLLIDTKGEYVSLADNNLRSRDIDTLPPALKELVETQPGAGTRILRDKVELA